MIVVDPWALIAPKEYIFNNKVLLMFE